MRGAAMARRNCARRGVLKDGDHPLVLHRTGRSSPPSPSGRPAAALFGVRIHHREPAQADCQRIRARQLPLVQDRQRELSRGSDRRPPPACCVKRRIACMRSSSLLTHGGVDRRLDPKAASWRVRRKRAAGRPRGVRARRGRTSSSPLCGVAVSITTCGASAQSAATAS